MSQPSARAHRALLLLVMVALWALFYAPLLSGRVSLAPGDFSGQFVAFAGYQAARFAQGELPLWNPYNSAGFPFAADPQAAVFYPPRLLTLALHNAASAPPEALYRALELEMAAHALLGALGLALLGYTLTQSVLGGLMAGTVGAFSGYMSGYPPLQLAILEAGVWLPWVILGLHQATTARPLRWAPLLWAGVALGFSWLAGHSQTSHLLSVLAAAYVLYRVGAQRLGWRAALGAPLALALVAFGAGAASLLPGLVYLPHTARAEITFAAAGGGFPLRDVAQVFAPGIVSLFSPLYVGVVGLALALAALLRRVRAVWFWWGAACVALLLSFGARTPVYALLYHTLPGLRFFRGQERAAFIVGYALAIAAGYGAAHLARHGVGRATRDASRIVLAGCVAALLAGGLAVWGGVPEADAWLRAATLTSVSALAFALLLRPRLAFTAYPAWGLALLTLAGLELFSANHAAPDVYDPVPASAQLTRPVWLSALPTVQTDRADRPDGRHDAAPARIDGFRGLQDNFGSLWQAYDVRGISPLQLSGPFALFQGPFTSPSAMEIAPLAWELLAVQVVVSGFADVPVPATPMADAADRWGPVRVYALDDPRPFAHLVTRADVVDSDAFARALLADPRYRPRESVILHAPPPLALPQERPALGVARVTHFAPEHITIDVDTPTNAILTLAHPHYPGWHATLNDAPAPLLRAYGGLSAVALAAGAHTLTLVYRPWEVYAGLALSALTLAGVGVFALLSHRSRRRQHHHVDA